MINSYITNKMLITYIRSSKNHSLIIEKQLIICNQEYIFFEKELCIFSL